MKEFDLTIIGAGPAGLSAALYASRANLNVAIVDGGVPGGKTQNTKHIDNYLGMVGMSGPEIGSKFYNDALKFGAKHVTANVKDIKHISPYSNLITLENDEVLKSKSIIITTGLNAKKLTDVKGAEKFFGRGISTCLVCDGAFYRSKDIVVIGGGSAATEESIYASELVNKIYIINKFPSLNGEEIVLDRLDKLDNIEVHNDSELVEIIGEDKIEGVLIKEKGKNKKIQASGIFTYIGWDSTTTFVPKKILNSDGYIEINVYDHSTKIEGIFAAGDVIEKPYRQVAIAVSEGAKAALSAKKYLSYEDKG